MKKILLSILLSTLLFAATPEQVDRYLSISNADEQLVELETQFSRMQTNLNSISKEEDTQSYDMQLLSIRFKEYLQKHLSEDEMDEILNLYKNVILLQFVSATAEEVSDPKEAEAYVKKLETDPESHMRIELVKKISHEMYDKESMVLMFDNLMKPLLENAQGGDKLDPEMLKKSREAYVKRMIEETENETLYATRDFTFEELEALEKIAREPVIDKESKAVFGATAYALEEFFLSLAKRYDIKKHQPGNH
ncbi:hypothetical protein ACM66Z_05960 [Sulfurovum sp. ST-21]|uniref:DUF2059 domain-containing protein n=1 Tax=Sulfurovum indicum TaxID=2779528 RepID=A0A7M1S181_9BACT|nr:hypothetical protein [Sulfurovum indicum]QOR61004.1 hypothetical protein IMZ28_05920 [Sulfurovum indicum]